VVAAALPVSYLATGQRVPEDFLAASKDFLDLLFKQGWQATVPHMETLN
jgi:flagellar biosynthesis GTPase FlhF